MKMPLGARAPTLGSWSSGIENRADRSNVSWAWLSFMMEIVFFATCPGRTAPNFTVLLAGLRTKICGTRKRAGKEGSSVNEKKKYDMGTLVRQDCFLLFLCPSFFTLDGHSPTQQTFMCLKCPLNNLLHNHIITAGFRDVRKEKLRVQGAEPAWG